MAQARNNLDGSSLCFNLCFVTSCPERWMIRTAYGIKGNAYEDCYVPCCCPCCSANQMLQTTQRLGDPFGPSPGEHLLRGNRFLGGSNATCVDCFKATFFGPCAIASAVHTATGRLSIKLPLTNTTVIINLTIHHTYLTNLVRHAVDNGMLFEHPLR